MRASDRNFSKFERRDGKALDLFGGVVAARLPHQERH